MSKVASQLTCECRCSEVLYSSQATPFQVLPGEFQGNHVTRRISPLEQIQHSLATTTFVGKQRTKQQKRAAARSKRLAPYTLRHKNVTSTKQRVDSSMQDNGLAAASVKKYALQPVFPFQQLLTFIPSICLGAGIQSSSAGTAYNFCHPPNKQVLLGLGRSDGNTYPSGSGSYSMPNNTHSRPQTIDTPYSVVKDILQADNEGNDAKIATYMPQLLEEALHLANAFEHGKIYLEEQSESPLTKTMPCKVASIVPVIPVIGDQTTLQAEPTGIFKQVVDSQVATKTNNALNDISQLLTEASDLSEAFARGEIRIEEQKEPVVTAYMTRSGPVTRVVEDRALSKALADISQLHTEVLTELSDAYARTEKLIKEHTQPAMAETSVVDVTSSESVTATPVVNNVENKIGEIQQQAYVWCSLPNLDLLETEALFDGPFNDMDVNSIHDMYLPPVVPSTNINEVLESKEFSELTELIEKIKQESSSNSEAVAIQPKSKTVDRRQPKPLKNLSEGVSLHNETPSDTLDNYVPDMFLFSKSQQEEVKFDLFDIYPADSMAFDLHSDTTASQKRKGSFSDVLDSKRQRVWCEAPELYI